MSIVQSLSEVQSRIERARVRSGRDKEGCVEIVAISKGFPASMILAAYEAGLHTIGENRVQEAEAKFQKLPGLPHLERRLVGHLQSNKVRRAVRLFQAIDSVDSVKLGRRISQVSQEQNTVMPILVQVNVACDPRKFGFDAEQTEEILALTELPGIRVEGLMTIGAVTEDEGELRTTFQKLRNLRDELNMQLAPEERLAHLSMGMTADFEIAVEEGATMVRIGTALFGQRPT